MTIRLLPRDDRDDLRLSHFPWLLEPEAWHLGRAWVDRDLHRYYEHYSLPTRWLGPRSRWISDHDLATRFPNEGPAVPRRFILSAQAGSDACGAGDNTELSDLSASLNLSAHFYDIRFTKRTFRD